jgi:ribosomal protein S18 acetylase RimI-like enzyme
VIGNVGTRKRTVELDSHASQHGATLKDAGVVAWLIRREFQAQVAELGLRCAEARRYERLRERRARAQTDAPGYCILIAYCGSRPIGTVSARLDPSDASRGEVARLAVLPGLRGRELGAMLMSAAEAAIRASGARAIDVSIIARFERLLA